MKSPKSRDLSMGDAHCLQKLMHAAPVALAAAGVGSTAHAAIVYFDIPDQTVSIPNANFNVGDISLSGGGSYDFTTSGASFTLGTTFNSEKAFLQSADSTVQFAAGQGLLSNEGLELFSAGSTIDSGASTSWATYGMFDTNYATGGSWQGGATGYVGLRIVNGVDFNYGWAAINYDDTNNQITITDFAFESTLNTAIQAGAGSAVPEPATSALLLAAGALGVAAYRRRKARAA